ncbi:MAG: NAD-dependent epimerase/dehydratase family protein [Elusimicrobia bacterium]|nr:NAD-dependent epimerase/dehydratase family protein [Elusimicrobiota bacterium]
MAFWDGRKVLVTGGCGFVGSHLVEQLLVHSRTKITIGDNLRRGRRENLPKGAPLDIQVADLSSLEECRRLCRGQDVVLNLAAKVGGVGFNNEHPGTMFHENIRMNLNMLEAARLENVERFLVVSSACVYPRFCTVPTPESEGFKDSPEETNDGYGWAKRMAEFQAMAYHREFGMKIAIARPYNGYGPRDNFNPASSHVIAALVRRVVEGEDPVMVWGDGSQTRAFLFVDDFARGLLEVTEKYAECDPVNLGTDEEIRIKDLAELVLRAAGSKAKLKFDPSRPSGQPRRNCDTRKARSTFGFEAKIRLEEGLAKTVAWYRRHRNTHAAA